MYVQRLNCFLNSFRTSAFVTASSFLYRLNMIRYATFSRSRKHIDQNISICLSANWRTHRRSLRAVLLFMFLRFLLCSHCVVGNCPYAVFLVPSLVSVTSAKKARFIIIKRIYLCQFSNNFLVTHSFSFHNFVHAFFLGGICFLCPISVLTGSSTPTGCMGCLIPGNPLCFPPCAFT